MNRLILVPTRFELEKLEQTSLPAAIGLDDEIALCGFGVVAAAARAAALITAKRPHAVLLLGIAGSYNPKNLAIGQATTFSAVRCDGIGVGTGSEFVAAARLGWRPLQDRGYEDLSLDRIELATDVDLHRAEELLTCCAASATTEDAVLRARSYPAASAEDMEGYAVALACRAAERELSIIRGISNRAGDRNMQNWRVDEALDAAAEMAVRWLKAG